MDAGVDDDGYRGYLGELVGAPQYRATWLLMPNNTNMVKPARPSRIAPEQQAPDAGHRQADKGK